MLAGDHDDLVTLWGLDDERPITAFAGHTLSVTAIAPHPGGQLLASASRDGTVRLWRHGTSTETARMDLSSSHDYGSSLAWSPGGELLAVGTARGVVLVFAVE